ncbi:MAG TPA: hypothetical protein VFV34_07570 [Blastocatellia bacterium]|nr:hypothetical protein [Blastocatellia bacterium]
MDIKVTTYAVYLVVSICLTIWVAQTLFKNGRVFLVDVFHGNDALADSVNHLLVVGFYLINFGFVALALKIGYDVVSTRESIEALASKVGMVLLVLGAMHFFNMIVFSRIRRRAHLGDVPPPLCADEFTPVNDKWPPPPSAPPVNQKWAPVPPRPGYDPAGGQRK